MNYRNKVYCAALLSLLALLTACGGGGGGGGGAGSGSPSGSGTPPTLASLLDIPNLFLLFPNPQKQSDGTLQTNTSAYASAYYTAIDPAAARNTLTNWKNTNGFGNLGTGTEITVVFGDQNDLGYGRRMTARRNNDGTLAFMVENYAVNTGGGYGYSSLNVDAAVVQSTTRFVGTSAIEFSPSPTAGPNFVKFYNFAPDGTRNLMVDQDGLGLKAMPNICVSCHGGRSDPLTPAGVFATVGNGFSQKPGDTTSRLQALKVDTFGFSTLDPLRTRAAQEAAIKTINQWVLGSYPIPAATAFAEDVPRPVVGVNAGVNEWLGVADRIIKDAYGGDGMPNATYADPPVPTAWVTAGQTTLYQSVVAPACVTCHVLRGTANQSDIDFTTYAKFLGNSDRIKAHVFDRGNMPLAKIVYNKFWGSGSVMPTTLAAFLEDPSQPLPAPYSLRDSGGALLLPGRPLADPGPDRTIPQGPVTLSAANSLYASSYNWTLVSENGFAPATNATLTGTASATPTFNATANSTFVVRLVASSASGSSTPVNLTLVVNNSLAPAPSAIRFADIKPLLISSGCIACHAQPLTGAGRPPISYVAADYPDDQSYYAALRGRINFTDISSSPLLRKPSGHHHFGGAIAGFDSTAVPGAAARTNYDLFLNWILNDAPRI